MMLIDRSRSMRRKANCLAALFIFLGAAERASAADETGFSALCAARDLQVITSIEDRGKANDLTAAQLRAATFILMEARTLCGELHLVPEALATYDRALPQAPDRNTVGTW